MSESDSAAGGARDKPTPSLFRSYQALFDFFNGALFGGRLPAVVLNFSRKVGANGFFAPERWESGKLRTHEISVNPTTLKKRTPIQIASTVVHEMVHLQQQVEGTPSRTGYHNKEWADMMEAIGLVPTDTGEPGGRRVGQSITHYVQKGGRFVVAFERMMARRDSAELFPWQCVDDEAPRKKAKTPSRNKAKYSCPGCNNNVWGKPDLNLVCGDDGETYEAEEE